MQKNNFRKEYEHNIIAEDGTEYEVRHKVDISKNEKGKYHVLLEYTVSKEKKNIYETAMDFTTPRLIEGKHAPLIMEENIYKNDFDALMQKVEKLNIGEIITAIEKGMIKTTGRVCLAEKENGGMFLRKADINFRKNRPYTIIDLEKLIESSEGTFDAYFISLGKNKINITPESFSYSELTESPKRMFTVSHSEYAGFTASIRSLKEKCELGQEHPKLAKELSESMKRVENLFQKSMDSLMVSYKGKENLLNDYQSNLKKQEQIVAKLSVSKNDFAKVK